MSPNLQRYGQTDKGLIGEAPSQKEWHLTAVPHDRYRCTNTKEDRIEIERNVENVLFSPKPIRKVAKDDREAEFESEISNIGLIKLNPKFKDREDCHLPSVKDNSILPSQSESNMETDQQVCNLNNIDGENGLSNS